MKRKNHQLLACRGRRIRDRLARRRWKDQPHPMLRAGNIRYELAQRDRAITCGGIGAVHLLAQHVGLPQAINRHVRMLKRHVPYFESDHVLSLAYNILADGSCMEDLELLRTNEAVLEALGAQRLPDPTTAGDFCRRFETDDQVLRLQETINEVRLTVWKRQDQAGDVIFVFGADAGKALIGRAEALPQTAWRRLERPARYEVQTQERAKPENVKERVVRERGYKNLILQWEDVAEFDYQPHLCKQSCRMVALRKKIAVEQGMERLFEEYRYFFYITNDRVGTAEEIVFQANDRCDQENLIEQLKHGVQAMRNPLDNLHSNWAYMVMSSLAWTLKAWCGLLLPVTPGRWESHHREQRHTIIRMEFKRFRSAMLRIPCRIVKTGRRIIYRIMSWNPWTSCLLRLAEAMHYPRRC